TWRLGRGVARRRSAVVSGGSWSYSSGGRVRTGRRGIDLLVVTNRPLQQHRVVAPGEADGYGEDEGGHTVVRLLDLAVSDERLRDAEVIGVDCVFPKRGDALLLLAVPPAGDAVVEAVHPLFVLGHDAHERRGVLGRRELDPHDAGGVLLATVQGVDARL